MMNTKYKLVRLVVSAVFGSLLWAGCASEKTCRPTPTVQQSYCPPEQNYSMGPRPANLIERRADTHPEWLTASEDYAGWQSAIISVPVESDIITEAAGAGTCPP